MSENAKTVLVTGAARGIGLATARRFLAEGWNAALIDIDAETLEATAAALNHPRALPVHCDVSDPEQAAASVAATEERFGRLDALVNNAGIAVFGPMQETSFADWRRIMATNLDGPFLMVQAATDLLARDGGGPVVNIGSISGVRASTLRIAYGTSKAALAHLSRQQAVELAELGIRVNTVAPGPVETAMARAVHTPAIRRDYRDSIPLGRYGTEEELAATVYFLCSPEASYITGQTIAADGGFQGAGIGLSTLRGEGPTG